MEILLVATFEDFDETVERRHRGPGNGRKHASQALVAFLDKQLDHAVGKLQLLILDWKNPPKAGPREIDVTLGSTRPARRGLWGSREQLLGRLAGTVWDFAICSQARRGALDFTAQFKAKRHLAMLYDYDLPFGPWGQEQSEEHLSEHRRLLEAYVSICTSQHLAEFVRRWSACSRGIHCCNAADYGYFDAVPAQFQPWEAAHQYVTVLSPCPEKGLCILVKLASLMPDIRFLAVKTTAWTKPWHEQVLKRIHNIELRPAVTNIDEIFAVTRVLLVPSLSPEAFNFSIVEAQLRAIPVISSGTCGLREANRMQSTIVPDPAITYDPRTRELIVGMTLEEAAESLDHGRAGVLSMDSARQAAVTQESCQKVADDSDVQAFAERLRELLGSDEGELRKASKKAHATALDFVVERRDRFLTLLQSLLAEHVLEGDAQPKSAAAPDALGFAPPPRAQVVGGDGEEELDTSFDPDQDFTTAETFDGRALAARVLVRLCEQGNIGVAAELLQAKASVDMAEAEVGVTPLVGAANAGHREICRYLARKGAEINLTTSDGTGRTALHAAAKGGFASVVEALLELRANARAQDLSKTSPLHLAVKHGNAGVAELLLRGRANPNQADDQGQVPINDAVARDRFDLAGILLGHGSLVNVRNMAGLEAISFSRSPAMQALIMKHDVHF